MTWQRIDENTYIDDTLVTCAEYQLFINEMREQGKYYQPDHWTSYQFPAGQAHEPILGVRNSDAVAFCEWLTKLDAKEWGYRIPSREETGNYPLKSIEKSQFGYWVLLNDNQSNFVWIGSMTSDFRHLGKLPDGPEVFRLEYPKDSLLPDRSLDRYQYIDKALKHARFQVLHRPTQLDQAIINDRNLVYRGTLNVSYSLDRSIENNHKHSLSDLLNVITMRAQDLSRDFINGGTFDKQGKKRLEDALNLTCELYFDIITLRERMAGRSPAFEGIRLVKERTR